MNNNNNNVERVRNSVAKFNSSGGHDSSKLDVNGDNRGSPVKEFVKYIREYTLAHMNTVIKPASKDDTFMSALHETIYYNHSDLLMNYLVHSDTAKKVLNAVYKEIFSITSYLIDFNDNNSDDYSLDVCKELFNKYMSITYAFIDLCNTLNPLKNIPTNENDTYENNGNQNKSIYEYPLVYLDRLHVIRLDTLEKHERLKNDGSCLEFRDYIIEKINDVCVYYRITIFYLCTRINNQLQIERVNDETQTQHTKRNEPKTRTQSNAQKQSFLSSFFGIGSDKPKVANDMDKKDVSDDIDKQGKNLIDKYDNVQDV